MGDDFQARIDEMVWENISGIFEDEVLWTCGCVTDLVDGEPAGFKHVTKSCMAHKSLWPRFGITFD